MDPMEAFDAAGQSVDAALVMDHHQEWEGDHMDQWDHQGMEGDQWDLQKEYGKATCLLQETL